MTLLQAIRILKQTAAPRRTRVLIEQILPLLTNQEFDMLKEAIELERLERTYSGEDQQAVELSEVKIEIKTVTYTTQPNGAIDFVEKNILKLTHKKDQTVRYIRLISMEPQLFDEFGSEEIKGQALLKVEDLHPEFLTPTSSPRTYYFPTCMKTQFSKKEWQVEAIKVKLQPPTKSERTQDTAVSPRRFDLRH
jgi:hypothetical protein